MINVSKEFKEYMAEDKRNFLPYVDIVLIDGTKLSLDNSDIWQSGFKISDGVSASGKFTIGSCIINKLTLTLNNIYDQFSQYDFDGAIVTAYLELRLSERKEKIQKGIYTVDNPKYNGSTITLECLDNMAEFDVDYNNIKTSFPATLRTIVSDICKYCGVPLATTKFENYNYVVYGRPDDNALSCRQVLVYCAQLACCFGRCNTRGELELKWFDVRIFENNDNIDGGIFDDTVPYFSGGGLDGGDFEDYAGGDTYDGGTFSGGDESNADGGDFIDYENGANIDGGAFDNDSFNYQSGDGIDGGGFSDYSTGDSTDGGTFDGLNTFHHLYSLSGFKVCTDDVVVTGVQVTEEFSETEKDKKGMFTIGTPGYVLDISGNKFIQKGQAESVAKYLGSKLIGLKFRPMSTQSMGDPTIEAGDLAYVTDQKSNTYNCLITNITFNLGGFMSISCDADTPNKNSSKQYSELTQSIVSARKEAQKQASSLADVMAQSFGVFKTEEAQADGSIIYYTHDKPTLSESMNIWKFTAGAFAVSTDGGNTWNAGMDANGNATVNILSAIGINCDWIHAGTLILGGENNQNGKQIMQDANGDVIGIWDKNGIDIRKGNIKGANLTLGGENNQNGSIVMMNSDGKVQGKWNNGGFKTNGSVISDEASDKMRIAMYNGSLHVYGKDGTISGIISYHNDGITMQSYGGQSSSSISLKRNGEVSIWGDSIFLATPKLMVGGGTGIKGRAEFSDGSYLEYWNGVLIGGKTSSGKEF